VETGIQFNMFLVPCLRRDRAWIPANAEMTIWVYFNNRLTIMKALIYKIPPHLPLPSGWETALSEPEALLSRRLGRRPKRGNPSLRKREVRRDFAR